MPLPPIPPSASLGQLSPYSPGNSAPNTSETLKSRLQTQVMLSDFTGIDITGATTSTGVQAALDYCGSEHPGGFGTPGYCLMLPTMQCKLPAQTTLWFNHPYNSIRGAGKTQSMFVSQNTSFQGYVANGILTVTSGTAPTPATASYNGSMVSCQGQTPFIVSGTSGSNFTTSYAAGTGGASTGVYIGSSTYPATFFIDVFAFNPSQSFNPLPDFSDWGIFGITSGDGITCAGFASTLWLSGGSIRHMYVNVGGCGFNFPSTYGMEFEDLQSWSHNRHAFIIRFGAMTSGISLYGHQVGIGMAGIRGCDNCVDLHGCTTDQSDYNILLGQNIGATFYGTTTGSSTTVNGIQCTGALAQMNASNGTSYVSGGTLPSGVTVVFSGTTTTALQLSSAQTIASGTMLTISDCQVTGNVSTTGQLSGVTVTGGQASMMVGRQITNPGLPPGTVIGYYNSVGGYYQLLYNNANLSIGTAITAGVFGVISQFCNDFPSLGFMPASGLIDNHDMETCSLNVPYASSIFVDSYTTDLEIRAGNMSTSQSEAAGLGGVSVAYHSLFRIAGVNGILYQTGVSTAPIKIGLASNRAIGRVPLSGYNLYCETSAAIEDTSGTLLGTYVAPFTFTGYITAGVLTVVTAPSWSTSSLSCIQANMWIYSGSGTAAQITGYGLNGANPVGGGVGQYSTSVVQTIGSSGSPATFTCSGTNPLDGTKVTDITPSNGTTIGSTNNFNPCALIYRGYSGTGYPVMGSTTKAFSASEPNVKSTNQLDLRKLYAGVIAKQVLTVTQTGSALSLNVSGYEKVLLSPSTASTYSQATFNTANAQGSDAGRNSLLVLEAANGNVTINHTASGTNTFFLANGTNLAVPSGESVTFERSITNGNWQQTGGYGIASSSGVTSITGTANQVIASASTGAVTLSLPQSINSGAAPTFAGTNFTGIPNAGLTNSSVTIGSTPVSLGGTAATIAGLTLTAPNIGAATGTSLAVTGALSTTSAISSATATAPFHYGTLTYTDTNMIASYQASVGGYFQSIWQNSSSAANASTDVIVSNNSGTATTYYGNFGMNSSGYTGSGSYNLANAVYLSSTSGDLVLGTTTSNAIHFFVNGGATDALTISSAGAISTPNQVTSTLATGTAPFVVTSTTPVANLSIGGNSATATSIAAGTANQIPYQTGAGATSFYSAANYGVQTYTATGVPSSVAGAAGVLQGSASAIPAFTTTPTINTTNVTSPSYTFATLPAATGVTVGAEYFVSDVGTNGSYWRSNGTNWYPVNGSVNLFTSGIPFYIMPGGSTITVTTGAVVLSVAMDLTHTGCYMWVPSAALSSGGNAWYWYVPSTTLAGTIYSQTYTSGVPVRPSSPTVLTTGNGTAFTQTTGYVSGPSISIPAGMMSLNGKLDAKILSSNNNSAGSKFIGMSFGGTNLTGVHNTATVSTTADVFVTNQGSLTNQYWQLSFNSAGAQTQGILSLNTGTTPEAFTLVMDCTTSGDWIACEYLNITYYA